MKIFVSYLLLVIVALYESNATVFTPCDDQTTSPSSVDIEGCDGEECSLTSGASTPISFTFVPTNDVGSVIVNAQATPNGLDLLRIDVPNKDACTSEILECPLTGGESYTYKNTFSLKYYSSDVDATWRLQDESYNDIVCFKFKIHLNA